MKRISALIAVAVAAFAFAAPSWAGMSDGGDGPQAHVRPACIQLWLPGSTQRGICR